MHINLFIQFYTKLISQKICAFLKSVKYWNRMYKVHIKKDLYKYESNYERQYTCVWSEGSTVKINKLSE